MADRLSRRTLGIEARVIKVKYAISLHNRAGPHAVAVVAAGLSWVEAIRQFKPFDEIPGNYVAKRAANSIGIPPSAGR